MTREQKRKRLRIGDVDGHGAIIYATVRAFIVSQRATETRKPSQPFSNAGDSASAGD
jgi:hypothetical protein